MGVREAVRINRLPGRAHQDSRQVDEPVRSDVVLGVPGCLDICPGVLLARAPLADPSPDHGRGHNDTGRSQRRLRDGGATTLPRVTAPTLSTRLRLPA